MNSEQVLETLKGMWFKYSSKKIPKWLETASEEQRQKYETERQANYEALNTAIQIVKAYRTLETAKESIENALNQINGETGNE